MAQHAVEVILMRQLADALAVPVFLVDPGGDLLFYNEAAEGILGKRFDETGPMSADTWSTAFAPSDADGRALASDELPLVSALREHRPAHRRFWIRGLDGVRREIEVTAFPLVGQGGRHLGGVAMFWEASGP
jgi:PAS domain-containing protein